MKRKELIRHLEANGCPLKCESGSIRFTGILTPAVGSLFLRTPKSRVC